ncbi:hypothetical protein [Streptosporangium sp. KLBMP 9127]|nr:hypothetical protein [Streptosporangium sp. KLBMP 9127]
MNEAESHIPPTRGSHSPGAPSGGARTEGARSGGVSGRVVAAGAEDRAGPAVGAESQAMPENLRLVGGEMLLWSDEPVRADGRDDSGGAVLRELVGRAVPAPGRVLLVGPHPEGFVEWLAGRARSVAVALRSFPDARRLAARHAGHDGVTVYCGRLEKLSATQPYDVVLALDGFERVHSAESPDHPWRDTLAEVVRLVAAGGTLILSARNELGVQAFAEAKPYERADGDWFPGGLDQTHPSGHEAIGGELASHGFGVERCYAGFPTARAPQALLAVEALDSAAALPDAITAVACARTHGGRPLLADPGQLARKMFRHGLAGRLAPVWVTVAGRHGDPPVAARTADGPQVMGGDVGGAGGSPAAEADVGGSPVAEGGVRGWPVAEGGAGGWPVAEADVGGWPVAEGDGVGGALPDALVAGGMCAGAWAVVHEVSRGPAGEWVRDVPAATATLVRDRVRREPRALAGPVPRGALLDDLLLTACAFDDVRQIRETLRHLVRWLESRAEGESLPGELVFATTDNLVSEGDDLALIDPSWSLAEPVPFDVALTRILWRFAVRLLSSGQHHPWPWTMEPDRLAVTLLAVCGRPFDRECLDRAKELEEELAVTLGAGTPGGGVEAPESYREVLAVRDRLRDAVLAYQARIDRLEARLTRRERELRKARNKLRNVKKSASRTTRPPRIAARLLRLLRGRRELRERMEIP